MIRWYIKSVPKRLQRPIRINKPPLYKNIGERSPYHYDEIIQEKEKEIIQEKEKEIIQEKRCVVIPQK